MGQRIGPYEVVSELGRGGMGVVYHARHAELRRDVALKVILPDQYGDGPSEEQRRRFEREAKAAASLAGHPNIVGVHDAGVDDEQWWLAMELVSGRALDDLIDVGGGGDHSFAQLARWIMEAARAVQHAHDQGILHRDLKPANILIDDAGTARVTDFGLARRSAGDAQTLKLTRSDAIVGTPAYMAPEQALGDELDHRADVYALGATLHAALTGKPPHGDGSILELLTRVIQNDPQSPRQRNPAVPVDLDTVVMCCLEKNPERRYRTAGALADDLERFLRGDRVLATRPGAVRRMVRWMQSHPVASAAAAVVVLAGGALGGGTWWVSSRSAADVVKTGSMHEDAQAAEAAGRASQLYQALSIASLDHLRRLEDHQQGVRLEPPALAAELQALETRVLAAAAGLQVAPEEPQVQAWIAFGRFLARDSGAVAPVTPLRTLVKRSGHDPFPAMLLARALLSYYADNTRYPGILVTDAGVEIFDFAETAEQADARSRADTAMKRARMSNIWKLLKAGGEYSTLGDALAHLQAGKPAEAAVLFQELLHDRGLQATAARLGAVAAMLAGDHKTAAEMLEEVAGRGWPEAWAQASSEHLSRGVEAQLGGEDPAPYWARAEHCVEEAIRLAPSAGRFYAGRGLLHMERGRAAPERDQQIAWFTKAEADYTAAIDRGYVVAAVWNNRGNARARLARCRSEAGDAGAEPLFRAAVRDATRALDADPTHLNALNVRAMTLLWLGEHERGRGNDPADTFRAAIRDLDVRIREDARPAARHFVNRGQIQAALSAAVGGATKAGSEALQRSREDLNTALQQQPENAAAWRSLGMTLRAMAISDLRQRLDPLAALREGMAAFGKAVELEPDRWENHLRLGGMHTVEARWLAGNASDPTEALAKGRAHLTKAIELAPTAAEPYTERGLAWLAEANWLEQTRRDPAAAYTSGLQDYDEAIGRDPNRGLTFMRRGALLEAWALHTERERKDAFELYERAAADYDHAVTLMPGHTDAAGRAALSRVALVRMALQQRRDPAAYAAAGLKAAHHAAKVFRQLPPRIALIRIEFAMLLERWDEAESAVNDALKLAPNEARWLRLREEIAQRRNR